MIAELASEPDAASPAFRRFLLYAAVRLSQRGYGEASDAALAMFCGRERAGGGLSGSFRRASARFVVRSLDRRPLRRIVSRVLGACASGR
jgi:hypothetical protein